MSNFCNGAKINFSKGDRNKAIREIAPYLNLGWQLTITIVFFAFIGWLIDEGCDTRPIFILVFSFLGIGVGFYNFFRTISELDKQKKIKEKKDQNTE